MNLTRTLPIDRNGNVYYGPRTVAELDAALIDVAHIPTPEDRIEVFTACCQRVYDAGFTGVAARVAKQYGLTLNR